MRAASAASRGEIWPALLSPSVRRITTLERVADSRSRFTAVAIALPIAVPSSSTPKRSRSTMADSAA